MNELRIFTSFTRNRKGTAALRGRYLFPVPEWSTAQGNEMLRIFQGEVFTQALTYPRPAEPETVDFPSRIAEKLFRSGEVTTREEAAQILSSQTLSLLIRSGVLFEDPRGIISGFKVQHYQGMLFLSDFFTESPLQDFVLQIGPAGHYLANLTIRGRMESALDLGCGCGVQSLLAARHCAQVTSTDINPRALALTRLNAEMNGLTNIETLPGSYFEPVQGRLYDLILANLPYVIAPDPGAVYRNTEGRGDSRLQALLQELPRYLKEGGYAQLLANWIHPPRENWWQRIQSACLGNGSDLWLIYNGSKEAGEYAGMWLEGRIKNNPKEYARRKNSWVQWYHRQGIEQVALGTVCLRKRSGGSNWFHATPVWHALDQPAGEQLQRLFRAQDMLSSFQHPEDLFQERWIPCQVEGTAGAGEGEVTIRSFSGMRLEARLSPLSARVLGHLDGRAPLTTAVELAAQEMRVSYADTSAAVLSDLRRLIELGMIVPG